jgi:hypothetical protein
MIRFLIKIGLILVIGILVYNRFFGDDQEKAQAKEVFKKTGDAVGATWNLLKSEKQKFNAGKYDRVLDQLGNAYQTVRSSAKYLDENVLQRLDDLERRKTVLEQQMDSIEMGDQALRDAPPPSNKKGLKSTAAETAAKEADQKRRKEALQRELDNLVRDTETLLRQAQEK